MVREFKLLNEKGQSYSLMDIENYCLLTEPSGLGYSYTTAYEHIGNTFITNLRNLEQGQISGAVNFKEYDNYLKLINFIEKSEKLRFSYKIPFKNGYKEYFKDLNIQSITKTEKQINGILSETIIFDCLSLWYEENKVIYEIKPAENELRWDFRWDSKFEDYDTRYLKYINDGHVEAPIELVIYGIVSNPTIELYIDGELYQTVEINVNILEFEKLTYGTKENEFYINKVNTDGTIENLFTLDNIDFENDNVVRIPKNKSCELKLKADNEISNAEIIIYPQYKAI